tara:strand:+ start:37265 stop:38167 length:903 start_codon:yes stop_codon:yes gene_type:complete
MAKVKKTDKKKEEMFGNSPFTVEQVKAMQKKKVYFATPCYGGNMSYLTALGYMTAQQKFYQLGIPWEIQLLSNESLVTRARNQLAMHFIQSDCTHLMFVDADIGFDGEPILHMLNSGKDVIGCVYPKKEINWDFIYQNRNNVKNPKGLQDYSAAYASNFELDHRGRPIVEGPFLRTKDLATGFMLISRKVFLKMMEKWPEKYYKPDYNITHYKDPAADHYAFFDCIIDPESKRYLSEDYYFTRKWKELGGELWVFPHYDLTHVGTWQFKGSLVRKGERNDVHSNMEEHGQRQEEPAVEAV